MGWKNKAGYGRFNVDRGKKEYAHRFMYEMLCGPIPIDKIVLHTCDNPICCNPSHLRIGTHRDNSDDKVKKDRQAKREDLPQSKLSLKDIEIINIAYPEFSQEELAKLFDVNQSTISRVIKR